MHPPSILGEAEPLAGRDDIETLRRFVGAVSEHIPGTEELFYMAEVGSGPRSRAWRGRHMSLFLSSRFPIEDDLAGLLDHGFRMLSVFGLGTVIEADVFCASDFEAQQENSSCDTGASGGGSCCTSTPLVVVAAKISQSEGG